MAIEDKARRAGLRTQPPMPLDACVIDPKCACDCDAKNRKRGDKRRCAKHDARQRQTHQANAAEPDQ